MAKQKKDLELLAQSITEGLKEYTIEEISTAIKDHLEVNRTKEVSFIFKTVAEHYQLTRRIIITGKSSGKIQEARKIIYCLIHYNLNLSTRHIAKRIFKNKWHSSVAITIRYFKTLDENIKIDREFSEVYKIHQAKLLNFISSNQLKQVA